MKIGLAMKDVSMSEVRTLAGAAEDAGLDAMLFPETGHVSGMNLGGRDPFLCASAALDVTTHLRAGPAIAATTIRSARAMAVTAATIHEDSDGRFLLGCGVSHRPHVEALGLPYPDSVLRHATAYVKELRDFSRDLVGYGRDVPIFLAALGPKMVALAAGATDGTILNWLTVEGASQSVNRYGAAGGEGESFLLIRIGDEESLRADAIAYRDQMPNYAAHFDAFGLDTIDDVVERTCLPSDVGAVAAGLRRYHEAGISVPCLYPSGLDQEQILELLVGLGDMMKSSGVSR